MISKLMEKYEWLALASTFALLFTLFFFLTISINGPFIVPDEADYHWLASEIYNYQQFYGSQFNPLYPLLIAPTFNIDNLIVHFYTIKLLNIFVYASSVFPVYLIGRTLLASKKTAILVACITTLGPFSAYSYLVWAEPLYFSLICWGYYFIVRYLTHEVSRDIFIAGMFIGLGFLAKQAALFLLLSFYAYALYMARGKFRNLDIKAIVLISTGMGLIILPWIIRNTLFGEAAVGYSGMFTLLISALKNDPLQIAFGFVSGIGHAMGYWLFVYIGVGLVLIVRTAMMHGRSIGGGVNAVASLAKIMLIHMLILMLLSELFLAGYGHTALAKGRYVDVVYPIAIIVIVWSIHTLKQFSWAVITSLAVFCLITLQLFSPFTQVEAYGVVNNSGVSILNLFWPDKFFWARIDVTSLQKLALSVSITALLVTILVFRKKVIWIVYFCILLIGLGAQLQVVRLGKTTNPISQVFLELDKQGIPKDKVIFDNEFLGNSFFHHVRFWYSINSPSFKFFSPISIIGEIPIDFGQKENKVRNNELKIWAPWNSESGFREDFGLGFNNISTLNAAICPELDARSDFVFDRKPTEFKFNLPVGSYTLRVKSADTKCLGIESNFIIEVQNGGDATLISSSEFILPFVVNNGDKGMKALLTPNDGTVWSLDEMSITPVGQKLSQPNRSEYILSKRLLPLPRIFNVFGYRLYKLSLDNKSGIQQ